MDMTGNINLSNKVAIVTGGGRGIGKAIAMGLAECGATVIVNYNGSADAAMATVEEIKSQGGKAEAIKCNVADFSESEQMIKSVLSTYEKVDILVNNAGITKDNLLLGMKENEFDDVININLKGTFNMIKHLSRNFLKLKAGRIINISSVSGVMGNAGQANYSASKAGIIGLTKSVAREFASRGICVNAVAPGFVETDMTKAMPEKVLEEAKKSIPLGRVGRPEDIAAAVVFLASEAAGYITGQVICVDGGMTI